MNLPFQKYAEEQADRILSRDRTNNAYCFVPREDISNVKMFAEYLTEKGVYVRVEKTKIIRPFEEEIYCFIISKNPLWGQYNPSFDLETQTSREFDV